MSAQKLDWLVELGVEELPVSLLNSAISQLRKLVPDGLQAARLSHGEVWVGGTPRRLAFWVNGVDSEQKMEVQVLRGPSVQVALDASGKLTQAGEGFFKRNGISHRDYQVAETPKGSYLEVKHTQPTRAASDVLAELLPKLLEDIQFQKSMRWGEGAVTFARPVQWLVALLGETTLRCEFAGARAGRQSRGHRFLKPEIFEISSSNIEHYKTILRDRKVVVDVEERQEAMLKEVERLTQAENSVVVGDPFLVEENTSLVEWPFGIWGSFESRFLTLPDDVTVAVMKGHQRYFAVRSQDGKLANHYVAVANTAEDKPTIARGNDRVLRARLSDSQFFLEEDKKSSLESRREKLDRIVFQAKLGSVGDKVRRIGDMVDRLARDSKPVAAWFEDVASVDAQGREAFHQKLRKTIELSKCDLVTLMVGEFPELEGKMGRWYLEQETKGTADVDVARAIEEHYQPKGANDAAPSAPLSLALAILDRVDTLVGCFAIGLVPSGSADPFALRRAVMGILKCVRVKALPIDLGQMFALAYNLYEAQGVTLKPKPETMNALSAFVKARLRSSVDSTESKSDGGVDAVLECWSPGFITDFDARAAAVRKFIELKHADAAEYELILTTLKRAANITKDVKASEVLQNEALRGNDFDKALCDAFVQVEGEIMANYAKVESLWHDPSSDGEGAKVSRMDRNSQVEACYTASLTSLLKLASPLNAFFENVLVMDPNESLKSARLDLLKRIADLPKSWVDVTRMP